jgi:hypothetical protein
MMATTEHHQQPHQQQQHREEEEQGDLEFAFGPLDDTDDPCKI